MATAARKKTYNPYDDVKAITEYKGNYHTAKEMGGDYLQWQKKAVENYNNLIENGYRDVADELTASDYTKSLDVLKRYQPTTIADDYYSAVTGDLIEESKTPKLSESAQKLFDSYYSTDNTLNGAVTKDSSGNVVSGLNIDHYNTGKNQLGYLNNFDVTAQPYYKGIMERYQLFGENAAQGELASGASSNSGNIDSFAQANANRQQLAFTTAGIEAALAAANQNHANWQNVYDRMTAHLGTMGDGNNQKLGYAADLYKTDSAERQNALNAAATLAQQEMINKVNKYLGEIGYDGTVYQADSGERQNQVNADTTLAAAQLQVDADREAAEKQYLADMANVGAQKYGYDVEKQIADAELKSAEQQWLAEQQLANGGKGGSPVVERASEGEVAEFAAAMLTRFSTGADKNLTSVQSVINAVLDTYPGYSYAEVADMIDAELSYMEKLNY
ncbi:MAG: hypothetical protein E7638_03840 [Ruminococcaceae bacterium]|nr:hypothetical protein [Oscillospiraceae bacterium]